MAFLFFFNLNVLKADSSPDQLSVAIYWLPRSCAKSPTIADLKIRHQNIVTVTDPTNNLPASASCSTTAISSTLTSTPILSWLWSCNGTPSPLKSSFQKQTLSFHMCGSLVCLLYGPCEPLWVILTASQIKTRILQTVLLRKSQTVDSIGIAVACNDTCHNPLGYVLHVFLACFPLDWSHWGVPSHRVQMNVTNPDNRFLVCFRLLSLAFAHWPRTAASPRSRHFAAPNNLE